MIARRMANRGSEYNPVRVNERLKYGRKER